MKYKLTIWFNVFRLEAAVRLHLPLSKAVDYVFCPGQFAYQFRSIGAH